jgi:hypothetical protein
MRRRAQITAAVVAAAALAIPAQSLGQAQVGSGSAASEYGDYVPTTSGHTSTPTTTKHHSSSSSSSSAPRHTYTPPRRYYAPQTRTTPSAPATPAYSGTSSSAAVAPKHKKHKKHRRHAAAAKPKPAVHKSAPSTSKQGVTVPASPASSVDGGSHQLLWLGLAMISMTAAVFARAGLRRRHGSV